MNYNHNNNKSTQRMQHPRNSKGYTKTLLWCLSFYDVLITVRWQRLIMASLWRPRASHWSNKKCVAQLSPCPFIWHITQYGFFKFVLQGQLWPKMLMKVNPSTHVSERLHILLWGLTHKNVIPYFLLCSDLYRIFKKMISAWAVTGIYHYAKFEKMISCKLWMLRCKHTITYSLPSRGE